MQKADRKGSAPVDRERSPPPADCGLLTRSHTPTGALQIAIDLTSQCRTASGMEWVWALGVCRSIDRVVWARLVLDRRVDSRVRLITCNHHHVF